MQRKVIFISLSMLLMSLNVSCVQYVARYDGPYEGKVVDADNGQPLEGVVILGVWYKEEPTVAGSVSSYYDARETVTDKNGEFTIPGMGVKILSNIGPMKVLIFKAGYEYLDVSWNMFKENATYKKKVIWEGKKVIIHLWRLTMEKRGKRIVSRPEVPAEKMKMLTREMNKERVEKGLSPLKEVE